MSEATIGIIGGSGLYQMEAMTDVTEVTVDTPYGPASDSIVLGTLEGSRVAFLPRHGRGHRINPSEVPYRANVYALKTLGVERIVSVNAVGSLREEMEPTHIVIPDQLIDRTKARPSTFFEKGVVAHLSMAEPFCPQLRQIVHEAAVTAGATVHDGGTYVVMEGPQFSTRAESELYRSWKADIIGMTALPEAKLAREAEICYAVVAFVTDFDCWHPDHESVTTEMVINALLAGADTARATVQNAVKALSVERTCGCGTSLASSIVTAASLVPQETLARLAPIAGRYLSRSGQ